MEEGNWDEANRLKVLLEDKQRAAARQLLATSTGLQLFMVNLCVTSITESITDRH